MVHAFSQLMHNKSHELTHLVWHHWQKLDPIREAWGLADQSMKEAHLGLSWLKRRRGW